MALRGVTPPSGGGSSGTPASTVTDETTFGIATAVGTSTDYARADHTHGSPIDPVTAHVAAGDPHTQYQRESEKDASSGYAGLSASTKLAGTQQTYGMAVNTACEGNDARLSDARTPTAHATSHQNGGSDEISVTGLSGLLADGQTPLAHATSHQDGGADEVSVTALSGLLADAQKVEVADEGTLVGTRKRINFTGAGVSAADDVGNDRVNVTISGGAGAGWTVHEQSLVEGWRGKFTITDAGISPTSKVIIQQAPGPYTGKGTRADEAEMDPLWCTAEPGSGQATVYWRSVTGIVNCLPERKGPDPRALLGGGQSFPALQEHVAGRVRGNVKFLYTVA